MKTIIILASIYFFFISTSVAQAQIEVQGTEYILAKLRFNRAIEGIRDNTYQDIEGEPFMFEDFLMGNIKLKDEGTYNGLLRFDKYAGEIHFKKENDIYAIAFPEKTEYIEIDDTRFIYSEFQLSGSTPVSDEGAYFVVLLDDKCKLLAKKNITIKDAQQSKGVVEAKPAKFINQNDSYFLKIGDTPAVRIKTKKDLNLFFENKGAGISDFIKKEKIKTNDPEGLVKLAKFYNKQLSQ
ncbi:MAG: hypothetical protein HN778_13375 [Prolixibacteraceae bacterium]|jgi:hypothetical protein|nr:hypothetical protein [Prolixibacteraceae bacterium]MBT6766419.1 hypothetical protein [Prolixibacteraceae bacterium]MBT7000819.1 hypothetical protein [Prolixibacteraceae bacterium]MBT7395817.1 hypothetical protein [Prolixibacteraceae bacterium]